jgi:hypothetical protein
VKFPGVVSYLVTSFQTAATALAFTPAVKVFDGLPGNIIPSGAAVLVGSTGEDDDGGIVETVPSLLGPGTWHEENGRVICSAWSSLTGNAAARLEALTVAQACVNAVHADRTLGGLLLLPTAVGSELRYQPRPTDSGVAVRVLFTVSYEALITS